MEGNDTVCGWKRLLRGSNLAKLGADFGLNLGVGRDLVERDGDCRRVCVRSANEERVTLQGMDGFPVLHDAFCVREIAFARERQLYVRNREGISREN